MSEKVLFVDDEPLVLDGYRRMLHKEFEVHTAVGGEKGLQEIKENGPFAVVISDMRMPEMNGAKFLSLVREHAPDSVRMLLTGYTDVNAAMDAVNDGNIFRYLTKPCEKQVLMSAINVGVVQYRTVIADKELVNKAHTLEKIQALEREQSIHEPVATTTEATEVVNVNVNEGLSSVGLQGPAQARSFLSPLLGVDAQCYVLLFRLTVLPTIEQRYGVEAVQDYLNFAAQYLMQALRAEDRLFHWRQDILMAVVRRNGSFASVRIEFARLVSGNHEYLINANGRCVMITSPITYEMLPASQVATFNEMLEAFDAKAAHADAAKVF